MEEDTRRAISTVTSHFNMTLAMLIHELGRRGSLDAADFVKVLRRTADRAEQEAPDKRPERAIGYGLMRHLADTVESGPDAPRVFKPTIIDGGREED
jgi:hypothetical protein